MTEGLLREEEIVEEIRGVLDDENENDDVKPQKGVKSSSQQGRMQGTGAMASQTAMFPIANNCVEKPFKSKRHLWPPKTSSGL